MEFIKDKYDKSKYIKEHSTYIECKGGDGTLLRGIKHLRHLGKPFFGIGAGTLNFLMNPEHEISPTAKYKIFNLIKVKVYYTWETDGVNGLTTVPAISEFQSFNEIFISEENGWVDFDCNDDDEILGNFKGSGLIVSTAQGSTGINKNNNGVILPLSSNDWSITGDKTNRKINYVLENNDIDIKVKSRGIVNLYIDGKNNKVENISRVVLSKGDIVEVIFNKYNNFKKKRVL